MRQSKLTLITIVLVVGLSACTKERREALGTNSSSSSTGPATLSTIQTDIFRLGCSISGCHDNRNRPAANLSMVSLDATYNGLVNRASTQALNSKIVLPGDPDHSYLINKLRGTHLSVEGSGDRMPQYAASLDQGDIDRIAQWITDGAQRN